MVTNMKLSFTNVPLIHNSACVVQNGWDLQKSLYFHEYFLMDLKLSNYCFLSPVYL